MTDLVLVFEQRDIILGCYRLVVYQIRRWWRMTDPHAAQAEEFEWGGDHMAVNKMVYSEDNSESKNDTMRDILRSIQSRLRKC